ncbi:MAG: hypothetical protein KAJ29_08070 [Alphaproteobacteria bacterium]|nr:hypothetical protein [Alphaproteobacteria bacterium]
MAFVVQRSLLKDLGRSFRISAVSGVICGALGFVFGFMAGSAGDDVGKEEVALRQQNNSQNTNETVIFDDDKDWKGWDSIEEAKRKYNEDNTVSEEYNPALDMNN